MGGRLGTGAWHLRLASCTIAGDVRGELVERPTNARPRASARAREHADGMAADPGPVYEAAVDGRRCPLAPAYAPERAESPERSRRAHRFRPGWEVAWAEVACRAGRARRRA